jgi:aldehyde:ferredoxin oxidoreductase
MARGYMGKILDVDLSDGTLRVASLDEALCRRYIGGYGLGARLLYDRIPPAADPLGPANILGFMTGPLTGTPALIGSRFVVIGKSPKTNTWGDANCGGRFGPHLKFAGYDGILFRGIAEQPVYLFIDEGEAELREARHLWGKNVAELEELLTAEHGRETQIASIGVAGEKRSLSSCVITEQGRSAGRSGLGALMGSKNLKAVAVKGEMRVPVADEEAIKELRRQYIKKPGGAYKSLRDYGTCGGTAASARSGDSPVRNWAGAGPVDFPQDHAEKISDDSVIALQKTRYGCWQCPISCGGRVKLSTGRYALSPAKNFIDHKPEYETLWAFGTNLLNDNLESIVKANEICNEYGLDTISVGASIAFAMECYEHGLVTSAEANGLDLSWGNDDAIVALTERIARREGLGELLADGVRVAAARIGHGAERYAIHVQGEELPGHDPRFMPGLAMTYLLDATPGRHTQGGELLPPPGIRVRGTKKKYAYKGKAEDHYKLMTSLHVVNAAGLCMFGYLTYHVDSIAKQLTAVTGWEYGLDDIYETGMRIATMRHLFNLREGHNPLTRNVPGRMIGDPPLDAGRLKGITIDHETMIREFLEFVDWDSRTSVPSEESLRRLGMEFVLDDLPGFPLKPF